MKSPCTFNPIGRVIALFVFFTLSGALSAVVEDKLKVGIKRVSPFIMEEGGGIYSGISADLWEEVARELELSFEYVMKDSIGDLLEACKSKELDLAVAAITITPERMETVDFSSPVFNSSVGVAMRKEKPGLIDATLLVLDAWLLKVLVTLAVLLLLVGLISWLLERKGNPDYSESSPVRGIGQGIWWACATMTAVGYGDTVPRSFPGRILGIFWMVAGVVMISLFTGSLASTLTRNQMTVGVSEYNDLANVSIGVVEGENPMSLVRNKGLSAAGYSSLSDALFALSERKVTTVVHDEPVIRHWLRKHPQQA